MILTYERALHELNVAVVLKGADHTAKECIISDARGKPVCIVGQVLWQIDPEKFEEVKPGGAIGVPLMSMGIDAEESAYELLLRAQMYQDLQVEGSTGRWGAAVKYAAAKVEAMQI